MEYHLAQVNIGRTLGPIDDPVMAEFMNNLDRINALAEASEGFVWRLKGSADNVTSIQVTEGRFLLVNLSVWRSIQNLYDFTYRSPHAEYVRRRAEWFEKIKEMVMCCWYVPEGHEPTVAEAMERIAFIRENGVTPYAFTIKHRFTAEEALGAAWE